MTRYTFMLHANDAPEFLVHLRELGVVDITTLKSWQGPEQLEYMYADSQRYMKVVRAMKSIKGEGDKYSSVEEAVNAWESATSRIDELESQIKRAEEDLTSLEIWGEFDRTIIESLKKEGIRLHYFTASAKDFFPVWEQMYALQVVARRNNKVYFTIATEGNEEIDIKATEVRAPEMSFTEKQNQIESYISEQKDLQKILHRASLSREEIRQKALDQSDIYNFEHTLGSAEEAVEGYVKVYEGWSEKELTEKVVEFAEREGVIFFFEDAKIENNPPIKLKNNFFSRLYEPVGKLYMNPAYNELDLTPFFAPFFMIFFGMCLGDAGYGLMFIIAAIVLWKKIPAKMKDMAWLVIILAASGMVFGLLSGNFCGIQLANIECLKGMKDYMLLTNPINSFYFSIALGVIQVLFGQILRIFNRIKRGGSILFGMSSIGWCLLFIGSMVSYAADAFSWNSEIMGMHSIAYQTVLVVSGILILFFANPKANIFASFGKGLYSIYEMATGIIGDLISYVRLFAIGLAGAIIAQVFNELALGLSGNIIILKQIIMLVILVVGHGLNIFVSSLGAFVHPVRLTFVEFYKNAEFEGGGRDFKPFRKAVAED